MGCDTYAYSLLFYKVYIKRENVGSWDSGLEKEQILEIISVLGMGVPRLACLRPAAWLGWQVCAAHLHQQGIQDPREGPSLARRTTQDLLKSGLARQAREGRRDQGKANLARSS